MSEASSLPFVDATGSFANGRYRGVRMPPPEWVPDADERSSMYQRKPIRVYNARLLEPTPSLDRNGFTLADAETAVTDLHDQDAVTTRFYDECTQLVRRLTGCSGTRVTQHQYRNGYNGLPAGHPQGHRPTANGSPGGYGGTHADISPYAENRWDEFVDGRHCAMFNVWRSTDLEHDIEVMPLSVCDMQTVAFDDMVAADAWGGIVPRRKLVSYRLAYNPAQRWYYFPRMTPNETLVFKQYDTRQEIPNLRTTYHGAIADPNTPDDAPLRETIEVRVLALFDKDTDREARRARFQAQVPKAQPNGVISSWAAR